MKKYPVVVVALLLAACAGPFGKFYQENAFLPEGTKFAQYSGHPKVALTGSMLEDANRLREMGYLMIGTSSFQGYGNINKSQVLAQAEEVKADFALWTIRNAGTAEIGIPVINFNPGASSTTNYSGNGPFGSYGGTSTTTSAPTFNVQTIQTTARIVDCEATFWKKLQR